MKNSNFNKYKVAVIGCGYWGSIITNSLLKIGIKKIYIYDQNYKNTLILKKIPNLNFYSSTFNFSYKNWSKSS